jgi:hypothetical protein
MRTIIALALASVIRPAAADDFRPNGVEQLHIGAPATRDSKVFAQDGALLGNVQGVEGPPGSITSLRVGVPGPPVIRIGASQVSYDAFRNVIVAEQDVTNGAPGGR